MTVAQVFQRICSALDRAGISHMLTGSFAGAYYGAVRSTQDIDLVIEADSTRLRALAQCLPETDNYFDLDTALEAERRRSLFNVIDLSTGWKIDLILRKSCPFSKSEFAPTPAGSISEHVPVRRKH
jgi:hypothetical protein